MSEYQKPPADLRHMYEEVHAVVRVQFTGDMREEMHKPHAGSGYPVTYFEARVVEVFKPNERADVGRVISVRRTGGIHDTEAGFERFSKSAQYVLFLRWVPGFNAFAVAWGPGGSFLLRGDLVHSEGTHGWSMKSNGKPAAEFLLELRSLRH